jgi:hypothetical protein
MRVKTVMDLNSFRFIILYLYLLALPGVSDRPIACSLLATRALERMLGDGAVTH